MDALGRLEESPDLTSLAELHLRLFKQSVAGETEAIGRGCHLFPINSIGYGGVHHNFIESLDWLGASAKFENFLCRVEAFAGQCWGYKELLRLGIAKGRVASKAMVRKVPAQLASVRKQVEDPGSAMAVLVAGVGADLQQRATAAVGKFTEAIDDLLSFFNTEYIPKARDVVGCRGLTDGDELYALCLQYHTTTTLSADEIHGIGLEEVERITQRYRTDVMDALKFEGSFEAFVAQSQSAKEQYYTEQGDLLNGYRDLYEDIVSLLPEYFEQLPASKCEIVAKDEAAAPAAYYMQGTNDGSRPGRFYVNVSNLEARPKYEMTALCLHEAMPGHHLQGSLCIENPSIPSFLRFLEDRRYEYCPARRQLYAAYLEGWALYCEALGEEMGVYKTPMALFGRLSMEMMRAVRLVVDTGIHAKGWSVEAAIAYMMEKTGMHQHECEAECYRYEAWPGQACACKTGEVAIWRMRREAEAALGGKFSLKGFHSVVLKHGPLPLDILASLVRDWVEEVKAQ